jgi:hypothetical protein
MKRAAAGLAIVASLWAAQGLAGPNYLGAERCKSSHELEVRVWAAGPQETPHKSLSAAQLKDAKCNLCHTLTSEDMSERFVGVQCERCHGSGKYYHFDFGLL